MMPAYSSIGGTYGQLKATNQKNYQVAEWTEPKHNRWDHLLNIEPLSTAILNADPIFFDALYDSRMLEERLSTSWDAYGGISRGAGTPIDFNGETSFSRVQYNNFLNGSYKKATFIFAAHGSTAHNASGIDQAIDWLIIETPAGRLSIQSMPTSPGSNVLGYPAHMELKRAGYTQTDTNKIDINIAGGHQLIAVTFDYSEFENVTTISLYINGQFAGKIDEVGNYISSVTRFGFGTLSGDASYAGTLDGTTAVSHVAFFDYLVPETSILAWPANMSIPTGAGYYIVVNGQWKRFLI